MTIETRVIEPEEIREVLQDPRRANLEWRSLYSFLYLTGARISEALDTKPRDIGTLEVDGHKFIKVILRTLKQRGTRKLIPRAVLIDLHHDNDLYAIIKERVQQIERDDAPIWYYTRKSAWRKAQELFAERTHALRHTFVTTQARRMISPYTVQQMAGWKSSTMLDDYRHEFDVDRMAKEYIDKK